MKGPLPSPIGGKGPFTPIPGPRRVERAAPRLPVARPVPGSMLRDGPEDARDGGPERAGIDFGARNTGLGDAEGVALLDGGPAAATLTGWKSWSMIYTGRRSPASSTSTSGRCSVGSPRRRASMPWIWRCCADRGSCSGRSGTAGTAVAAGAERLDARHAEVKSMRNPAARQAQHIGVDDAGTADHRRGQADGVQPLSPNRFLGRAFFGLAVLQKFGFEYCEPFADGD